MIYTHTHKQLALILFLVLLPACNPFGSSDQKPAGTKTPAAKHGPVKESTVQELETTSDFSAIVGNGKPTVAKFYAPWCPPCQKMGPIFAEIASKYDNKINFISLNSENKNLKTLFNKHVKQGFPTFVYFDKKGNVIETHPGAYSQADLDTRISKLIS